MSKPELLFSLLAICMLLTTLGTGGSCHTKDGIVNKDLNRNDKLATGVWGGNHISAEVTDRGADIEFDCAQGTIDQPILLDGEGNFAVDGKYIPQHAGPTRRDEENSGRSVRYVGHVKDQELTLTISAVDPNETIGSFTLTQGSAGRVMKCR